MKIKLHELKLRVIGDPTKKGRSSSMSIMKPRFKWNMCSMSPIIECIWHSIIKYQMMHRIENYVILLSLRETISFGSHPTNPLTFNWFKYRATIPEAESSAKGSTHHLPSYLIANVLKLHKNNEIAIYHNDIGTRSVTTCIFSHGHILTSCRI